MASPLSATTPEGIQENLKKNIDLADAVWKLGHYPFSPAASVPTMRASGEDWVQSDKAYCKFVWGYDAAWLRLCHVILLCDGWEESKGCCIERFIGKQLGLWIIHSVEELPEIEPEKNLAARMERIDMLYVQQQMGMYTQPDYWLAGEMFPMGLLRDQYKKEENE